MFVKIFEPLLSKGYAVLIDSYYNSPALAHFLKRHNTDSVGRHPQTEYEECYTKELKKGESIFQHSGPVTVLKLCDKQIVSMKKPAYCSVDNRTFSV
jgi:hypothetical protein